MLKLHSSRFYLLTLMLLSIAVSSISAQELTLEDIYFSNKYRSYGGQQIRFMNTSSNYTQLNEGENGYQVLEAFDIVSDIKKETIFNAADLDDYYRFYSYRFSDDDQMILLSTERERIYRYSTQSFFYIYDIGKKEFTPLNEEVKQMYPHFSPDNSKVGFIVDNNLFYKDLQNGEIRQFTFDGKFNHIINGRPDWVYEEEFTLERMYEWSEDGSKVLFLQFDESEVPEFSFMKYDGAYPYTETFKYPRAGEKNSKVILKLYDTRKDTLITLDIPYDYEYIPRIIPAGNGFAFMLLNRHQNHQRIVYYDAVSKTFQLIFEYEHDKYVDEPTIFNYIGEGRYMIANDRDGFQHIYIVAPGEVIPVTSGSYEVTEFYGMDEEGWLYFQSSEKGPEQRHIFKKHIESGEKKMLVSETGYNSAVFAGDHAYFVNTFSSQGVPRVITVRNSDGKVVRLIEDNMELRKKLDKFWSDKEYFEIDAGEYTMPAWMIKPPDFDKHKKYPVLNFVYGGPGRQRVRNEYLGGLDLWFQLLAQHGYIILCTDNRGTPGKGSEYKKAHYLQLGKLEVEDQLIVIDYLKSLPYVDGDRIGYYGWSYGGYMALLMLFQGQGNVKAALSVAPVTHWKFYDTIYTERFLRTPKENPKGYDDGSPVHSVEQWESGSLFLAHGSADDNVHFQNTTELVKQMNAHGKHYDLYIYPDGAHGMGGHRNRFHLFEKMTEFILEEL